MKARLKSEFWISAFVRRAQSMGAYATVLRKGDPDAGIALIILREGRELSLFAPERNFEGDRVWWPQVISDQGALDTRLNRRVDEDPDIWIVEVEGRIAPETLIGEPIGGGSSEPDPAQVAAQALFRGK